MEWVLEYSQEGIEVINELTPEEKLDIDKALLKLKPLNEVFSFFDYLNNEYNEYLNWFQDKGGRSLKSVIRLINNFLSAYKGFIDHWETYIKRKKSKNFLDLFEKSISKIYDENFEYRFIYNLRNFAQHNGNPVSSVSKNENGSSKILLNTATFLKEHNGMQKKFRKELNGTEVESLNVDQAIRVVYFNLSELHQLLINNILAEDNEKYLRASVTVLEIYNKYNKNGGLIGLIDESTVNNIEKMNNGLEEINLGIARLPTQLARTIAKSTNITFKFKGINLGQSAGFPLRLKSNLLVEKPKFKYGKKFVERDGIKWVQILESTSFNCKDGYDKLFSVYCPAVLTTKEYREISKRFEEKRKVFIK
ncbi:hypothetical protein [Halobacillus sp. A5]|uniref:hypothetical protein n=1 Tax=Halobacillus sp. A5 TaxID=2880263 RepID=UPI0020A64344|nr:hypothetical protein [Halobacillus sp. A5]MCP3025986.1 hypothetical protein [Halobacillus sp. A5]